MYILYTHTYYVYTFVMCVIFMYLAKDFMVVCRMDPLLQQMQRKIIMAQQHLNAAILWNQRY